MEEPIVQTFSTWFQQVRKQVRFRPDHDVIERELAAHYEDHYQDLRRLGYDESLAQERAIRAMGDPVQVGKALDAAHKPWLGWLWMISKVICQICVTLALLFFFCGPLTPLIDNLQDQNDWDGDYYRMPEYFWYNGSDEIPESLKTARLVATGQGKAPIERAGYTLTVPYAEVWEQSSQNGQVLRYYFVALQVEDQYFWDDGPKYLTTNLTLEDACGRYVDTHYDVYTFDENGKAVWGPADGYLLVNTPEKGMFTTTYYLCANVKAEPGDLGETAGLRYPYGTPWTLTIH